MRLSYAKGTIHATNNYGPIKIVHTLKGLPISRQRVVKFLATGNIRVVSTNNILSGTVADKQKSDKYGAGAVHTMNNGEVVIIIAKKSMFQRKVMMLGSGQMRTASVDAIYDKKVYTIDRKS